MKHQRLFIVLTVVNSVILLFQLFQSHPVSAQTRALPILRGRGLEIVDDHGIVRASIHILPGHAVPNAAPFPETVLLRLMDARQRPNVKLSTSDDTSVLGLIGASEPTYARIEAKGGNSFVILTNKDGKEQVVKP